MANQFGWTPERRKVVVVQASGEARAQLEAIVARADGQASAENFPVALRLLPRTPRAQLTRVYRFARFVDDVGDAAHLPADERLGLLAAVDDDLRAVGDGRRAELAAVHGLGPVLAAGVPLQPFRDLVTANVRDQHQAAYSTFNDLMDYCVFSAQPVGRIVLHLAGAVTPANVADSDSACRALQVLEHCQDVREDAVMNRVYLPEDDCAAAGVAPGELTGTRTTPQLRSVVATQVERAEHLLRAGAPLVGRLRGWARVAVAGYLAGGLATADALRARDFDVLSADIHPGKARTARHAARLFIARGPGR